MQRLIDILIVLCAAWIIVASFLFMHIRYANIAASVIIILQFIKLSKELQG